MYKDSKRTCTAIVVLIKPFVALGTRCRCRRDLVTPRPHVSGYFWICNFFFPDSNISPSTRSLFKSNWPVHTHSMVSGIHCSTQSYSALKCVQSMRHKAHRCQQNLLCCCCCAAISIGLLFGKRLETNLLRQSGFNRPHVIGFVADCFFPLWRAEFKNIRIRCRIRRMRVNGSCVISERKKLRTQKYPDSCGRGVKLPTHSYTQATVHIKWVTWYAFSFFLCSKHFLPLPASFYCQNHFRFIF